MSKQAQGHRSQARAAVTRSALMDAAFELFHSRYSAALGTTAGSNRFSRYSNPELDQLLKAADSEVDPEARKLKVEAVMEFLIQERPTIPLLASYSYTGYRKDKVAGIKSNAVGGVILDDVYLLEK